jgi:N-acetylated-alpha-linked acidic dipeptidase
MPPRACTLCAAAACLLVLPVAGPAAHPSPLVDASAVADTSLLGFSAASASRELALESLLGGRLENDSTGRYFRFLTEEPHIAGTPRNKRLAEYVRDRFERYGLDDVRMIPYDVLLPYPETVSVSMVEPYRFDAALKEDGYPQDKDSWSAAVGPTYMGMSADVDATADLVYANGGNPEDYDWLESQGIDVRGKVAIVRYSVPYSYRGFKALTAERRGVKALLIYSDPAEDGYRKGLVFPEGPWGPASHIQRGSITYDFRVPGDPLTPGWASVQGARRIPVSEARSVPHIAMVPMSWRDAKPLLENLGGPVAPLAWQGALPFTYRVGPGATKVHVKVKMDGKTRTIWDVVGRIRGSEEPDRMVVLGNHRDAWVYGAVDPSSGTATQIELARVLGGLLKEGHRPRRTIVLADWDAEEWHLTGSTEWGEQNQDALGAGGLAYINVDGSVAGPDFDVGAVASLNDLVVQTVRDVIDPNSRRSVLEAWGRVVRGGGKDAVMGGGAAGGGQDLSNPLDWVGNELGSGSDYTVFLNHLGMPIIGMDFDGPYGVYHSQYDDYYWMTHFGDPGFRYMTAMAEVWGRMALRIANADVLPYDFALYATRVGGFLDSLASEPGVADRLDLSGARRAQAAWAAAAGRLDGKVRAALASAGGSRTGGTATESGPAGADGGSAAGRQAATDPYSALNGALLQVERRLLDSAGIPNRPWFRHLLYAPKETYDAMSLPGVQEAVDAADWDRARSQLELLTAHLQAVAEALDRAAGLVPG